MAVAAAGRGLKLTKGFGPPVLMPFVGIIKLK
ncbi:MAG: hypothetical protein JWP37_2062 [Mucilaginibacter sp.]|nr:hypothetical protein [Mucilaginibacter sp.]